MLERHDIKSVLSPLKVARRGRELRLSLPEGPVAEFEEVSRGALSSRLAAEIVAYASNPLSPRLFVVFRRSSPEARAMLREAGIAFAGEDGHVFVRAPGVYVERGDGSPQRSDAAGFDDREAGVRNPFANRSSRVPRWMLGHPDSDVSPASLARHTQLNPAAVSRILTALEEAALISRVDAAPARGRERRVRLTRALPLLEEWLPVWERRRIKRWRWDIGAREVEEALDGLRAFEHRDDWTVGGLAGAALVSRAVEPISITVWASVDVAERMVETLDPVDTRGGRGTIEIALASDPWTLGLGRVIDGLPIADPAQLWLDCASQGERALEAADAVVQVMSWS
jgi:DNA-binding MarR family transcriptional regulator